MIVQRTKEKKLKLDKSDISIPQNEHAILVEDIDEREKIVPICRLPLLSTPFCLFRLAHDIDTCGRGY